MESNSHSLHRTQGGSAGGVVVRYGQLYGPGTYYSGTCYPDEFPAPPRIHVDDAARRTMALLDAASGVEVLCEGDDG